MASNVPLCPPSSPELPYSNLSIPTFDPNQTIEILQNADLDLNLAEQTMIADGNFENILLS